MSIFKLHSIDGGARAGIISTPHGEVPTPTFMSVATQGSVTVSYTHLTLPTNREV